MKVILQSAVNLIPYQLRKCIKYIPGIKQLQQVLMDQYLKEAKFIHSIKGGPASGLLYPVELPIDKQIWLGNYEQSFSEALASAVRPGMVCYDIGGYRGFFSGVMAMQQASAVFVFEPLPDNQEQIKKLIELNSYLPIKLFNLALADRSGEEIFRIMPSSSMGKLGRSKFDSGNEVLQSIPVSLETLDNLLSSGQIQPADIMKIDVEGAEAMVLHGARSLLALKHPMLFIESHSRDLTRECTNFLTNLGYHVTTLQTNRGPDYQTEPPVCHLKATFYK